MWKGNRKFWYVNLGQVVRWRQHVVCVTVGSYLMLLDIDTIVLYIFYHLKGKVGNKDGQLHGRSLFADSEDESRLPIFFIPDGLGDVKAALIA